MARDPAQGVINWFAALMVCVLLASAGITGFALWALWRLVRAILEG
ncbi:MAG: hypothetical protein SHS37scaffold220_26 [Phage 67_12]|nr:MAG: hypothetical protein SHS37scaffold220_26 [Phage 67_12]